MIKVSSIFQDVLQQIAKEENGDLSYDDFNRLSKRAELRLLYWVTGDARGGVMPAPYETQKNKDMVSPFILVFNSPLDSKSQFERPEDYYQYENLFSLEAPESSSECEEDKKCGAEDSENTVSKTQVKLLDTSKFYKRANTYIEPLKPSNKNPIAKQVGKKFEILPLGIQGVTLEYVRYPKYAAIKTVDNDDYNEPIIDEDTSKNYEWGENAYDILVYIIVDLFSNSVREASLKQANEITNKGINK